MWTRTCVLIGLMSGCGVDPNPTLNDQPLEVETLDLGEVNPWVAGEDSLRFRVFVAEPSTSDLRAVLDGVTLRRDQFRHDTGSRTLFVSWPRTVTGHVRRQLRLFLDEEPIGTWTVERTVVDVGVSVCALPSPEEGDRPRRCTRPSPFSDHAVIPPVSKIGAIERQLEVTVERAAVEVSVYELLGGNLGSRRTSAQFASPANPVRFTTLSSAPLGLGRRSALALDEDAGLRVDAGAFVEIRQGTSARFSYQFTATRPGMRLTGLDLPPGLMLHSTLPLDLPIGVAVPVELETPAADDEQEVRVWFERDGERRATRLGLVRASYPDTKCRLSLAVPTLPTLAVKVPVVLLVLVTNVSDDDCQTATLNASAGRQGVAYVEEFNPPQSQTSRWARVRVTPSATSGQLTVTANLGNFRDQASLTIPFTAR